MIKRVLHRNILNESALDNIRTEENRVTRRNRKCLSRRF